MYGIFNGTRVTPGKFQNSARFTMWSKEIPDGLKPLKSTSHKLKFWTGWNRAQSMPNFSEYLEVIIAIYVHDRSCLVRCIWYWSWICSSMYSLYIDHDTSFPFGPSIYWKPNGTAKNRKQIIKKTIYTNKQMKYHNDVLF